MANSERSGVRDLFNSVNEKPSGKPKDIESTPESEQLSKEEEKSEEFLNFENAMKQALSLTTEQAAEVRKWPPFREDGTDNS